MKYHSVVSAGQLLCTLAAALLASSSVDAFAINPSLTKKPTSRVSLWTTPKPVHDSKIERYEIEKLPKGFGDVTGAIPLPEEKSKGPVRLGLLSNSDHETVFFFVDDKKEVKALQNIRNIDERPGLKHFSKEVKDPADYGALRIPRNNKSILYVIDGKTIFEFLLKDDKKDGGFEKKYKMKEKFQKYPFDRVDAAFSVGKKVYFFCAPEYAEYEITRIDDSNEDDIEFETRFIERRKIKDENSPFKAIPTDEKISAVITDPKSGFAFFFTGREYFKYELERLIPPGPQPGAQPGPPLDELRFNKFPPIDPESVIVQDFFPLTSTDYESGLDGKAKFLKEQTFADSVVLSDDFQLGLRYRDVDIADTFEKDALTGATVKPVYPGMGDKNPFWNEMEEVVKAQKLRLENKKVTKGGADEASKLNIWPDLWYDRKMSTLNPWGENSPAEELTLELVAKSVGTDFSNYHQLTLLKTFTSNLVGKESDLNNSQKIQLADDIGGSSRSFNDFIGEEVRMSVINAWSLEAVAPVNFFLKWNYGVPRPEEVAWQIFNDNNDGVPSDLIKAIKAMKLENAADFTAYENGSPTHPSFPAMHSAASTCSLWIPALYDISDEQYLQTLRMDYAVAYARTVAGVHYPQDNLAGLNAGQRIIREKLPKFLSEQYGYDEDEVREKVRHLSFDWKKVEFEKDDCEIPVVTERDEDGTAMKTKLMSYKEFRNRKREELDW
eukprot:CAMPEP_0197173892 /NCGR_PEP_ID=MMETSP1423-20130617/639_1 /TAXON_ID=476441 /ORGANISM="Pseudo-nitzschia heimii, Strain UNC1101" /LENGTH=722 /DNA_ID=CAMNT_0042622761 /DNA_START=325 /DNA_END=2490 /DNA_ORIENTATION=+